MKSFRRRISKGKSFHGQRNSPRQDVQSWPLIERYSQAKDNGFVRVSFMRGWNILGLANCIWGCSLTPGSSKWWCCEDNSREGVVKSSKSRMFHTAICTLEQWNAVKNNNSCNYFDMVWLNALPNLSNTHCMLIFFLNVYGNS